jgi:cell division protein FtsW
MAKRVSVDGWLFTVTLILVFVGLVMIFSASAVMAKERYGSGYFFLLRQVGWAAGGIAAMLVAMKVDYRRYKHPGVVFSVLGVTTLMLISVFFLDRAHNTHRWIHFGGFSFQPSEVAKVALILFLAFFLENRIHSMHDWRNTLLPAVLPTLMFLGLIVFQPDLGTAIACAAITGCILFVAGLELRYLGYGCLQGKGFHIIQSLIAVSTGGVTGLGFMEGKQKLFYLPEPHTDFIFAVTAEELGLLGALVVVLLFGIFLWRGVRTALRTQDMFGRLLAVGITSMVVVQAFINMSVVLGIMPTKGIPLPFVSYGGSSLFVTLACVGVLLNITKQTD